MNDLLNSKEFAQVLEKMAREIIDVTGPKLNIMLVGIRSRGVPLAERIGANIKKISGKSVPIGILDITLYRDDLSKLDEQPIVKKTELPGPIEGLNCWLVDDVLYTGRTVRAAMDALFDFGRPSAIHLAVLIDRGGRELPVQADVVGSHYKAKDGDNVKVRLKDTDGEDKVEVLKMKS